MVLSFSEQSILFEVSETEFLLSKKYNETEQVELVASNKEKVLKLIENCGNYINYRSISDNHLYYKYKSETEYFKLNIEGNSRNLYDFAEVALEALSYKVPYSCQSKFNELSQQIIKLIDVSEYKQTGIQAFIEENNLDFSILSDKTEFNIDFSHTYALDDIVLNKEEFYLDIACSEIESAPVAHNLACDYVLIQHDQVGIINIDVEQQDFISGNVTTDDASII